MTAKNLNALAALAAILVIAYLVLDRSESNRPVSDTLIPELKSQINDVTSLGARNASGTVTIRRSDDAWVVVEREGYAADMARLRDVLVSIADAKIIERKTSDPEKYHLIGVSDPSDANSESTELTISGDGFEYSIIIGATAQTVFRYVRMADAEQSVLIDQNPDVPGDAAEWLADALVDIDAERVQQVIISHADGEEFVVEKPSTEAANYAVVNIPDGRELSYPSVANEIGAALAELTLDDVRPKPVGDLKPGTTTMIRTFDGLQIVAMIYERDDAIWISIVADAAEEAEAGIQDEVAGINTRLAAWQFAIPDHKTNLLKRRMEDLLKTVE